MTRNWRNANNLNNIITQKNWGKKYLIYTKQLPVIFKLPFKYKKIINDYVNYGIESKFPFEFTLQIIFNKISNLISINYIWIFDLKKNTYINIS